MTNSMNPHTADFLDGMIDNLPARCYAISADHAHIILDDLDPILPASTYQLLLDAFRDNIEGFDH